MKKIIKNANLFDGRNEELIKNATIVIENNLIKEITTEEINENDFDKVIDAEGRTVIPGLVDAHVHIGLSDTFGNIDKMTYDEIAIRSAKIAEEMLLRGFTTVRDVGSSTVGLKKCIDEGYATGPRIFPSNAAISQTCGHSDYRQNRAQRRTILGEEAPIMRSGAFKVADGVPEVLKATREQLFMGASQIKIMAGGGASSIYDPLDTNQYTLEELKAIVQAAADYGTYVCAHIHTAPSMLRAAEAGVKCFEHASLMTEEVAKVIAEKDIWVCSQYGTAMLIAERKIPLDSELLYQKTERAGKGIVKHVDSIKKYNIKSVFGTDLIGPIEVHEKQLGEFSARKKFFGSYEGLKHATGNAHELFKLCTYQNPYPEGKVGVLEEGSFADLIIVEGNPVENLDIITNKDNMKLIMKDGKVYKNII